MPIVCGVKTCWVGAVAAHGLTSRQRETAGLAFLDELLVPLQIPLIGLLLHFGQVLCHCGIVLLGFASKIRTWRLSPGGGAAGLVTDGLSKLNLVIQGDASSLHGWYWLWTGLVGLVEVVNEFDCTPREEEVQEVSSRIRVWKRMRIPGSQDWERV